MVLKCTIFNNLKLFIMKKLFTLAALAIVLSSLNSNAQVKFGIKAGLNIANASVTSGGTGVATSSITSFQGGLIMLTDLSEQISLQIGALLSGKGASYTEEGGITVTPWYLEIPVDFGYNIASGNMKIRPYAGLYLGIGVMGKIHRRYFSRY